MTKKTGLSGMAGMIAAGQTDAVSKLQDPVEAVNRGSDVPPPIELPAPSGAFREKERRDNFGVRVKPRLKGYLDKYVYDLRGQGWKISQQDVIEHWLTKLEDPAYARALAQEMLASNRKED